MSKNTGRSQRTKKHKPDTVSSTSIGSCDHSEPPSSGMTKLRRKGARRKKRGSQTGESIALFEISSEALRIAKSSDPMALLKERLGLQASSLQKLIIDSMREDSEKNQK